MGDGFSHSRRPLPDPDDDFPDDEEELAYLEELLHSKASDYSDLDSGVPTEVGLSEAEQLELEKDFNYDWGFPDPPKPIPEPICECGAEAVNSLNHSTYCPKYKT